MLKKIISLFKRPYPCDFSISSTLITGFVIGISVFIFMIAFQPFGLYTLPEAIRTPLYVGYGIVTFLSIVLNSLLLPKLLPQFFKEERWNTGKIILFGIWTTLLIGIGSYFGTIVICRWSGFTTQWIQLMPILRGAFLTGVILITVSILFESGRLQQRNERIANETLRQLDEQINRPAAPPVDEKVIIVAENNRDKFSSDLDELLHIDAEENYVQVHYKKEKNERMLMRSSMSRVERQLRPFYPKLFRCHRAHIVNISHIRKVTGNAQGLRLTLDDVENPIPVSRRYVEEFRREVINQL
jgi:hypothetical protein